jgi:hypothetical protein
VLINVQFRATFIPYPTLGRLAASALRPTAVTPANDLSRAGNFLCSHSLLLFVAIGSTATGFYIDPIGTEAHMEKLIESFR